MPARLFTYHSAQSRTLVVALSGVVLVESSVLHLWLSASHPVWAWVLTASSVMTLLWFWRDDARYRRGTIGVDDDRLTMQLGTRWVGVVARGDVMLATRPGWKDLPESGTPAAAQYVNVTKPADPNVLLELRAPVALRAFGVADKNVRRIGVHLDTPDEFISMVQRTPD